MSINWKKGLLPAVAAAVLAVAPFTANAALIMRATTGGNTVTVTDNGVGDLNGATGGIGYFGTLGTWEFTMAMGTSEVNPFAMHLTSSVTGTAGDAPITIMLTQTGLTAGSSPLWFVADGGGSGAGTASWSTWVDDTNTAFGQGTLVHASNGYSTSWGSETTLLSGLYSATIVTTIDYSQLRYYYGWLGSSLDVTVKVPEPASLGLLGLALMGVGAGKFRRRQAKA